MLFRIKCEVEMFLLTGSMWRGLGRNWALSGLKRWPRPTHQPSPGSSLSLSSILVRSILQVSAPSPLVLLGKSKPPDLFLPTRPLVMWPETLTVSVQRPGGKVGSLSI